MITTQLKQQVAADCFKRGDIEACGFIVDGTVVPCENVATNPETGFVIAPEDYAKAEELGTIECVYHSHINSNEKFKLPQKGPVKNLAMDFSPPKKMNLNEKERGSSPKQMS